MSALQKRGARGYVRRAQARAERRTARAKRRAKEFNTYPPAPRHDEAHVRLNRMFRGIHPIGVLERMERLERGRKAAE